MRTIIAFVVYETPFAPAGGIAAVMRYLPASVREASGAETIVFTPYHRVTKLAPGTELVRTGTVTVRFNGADVDVDVLRLDAGLPWYFLKATEGDYFQGANHPYDGPGEVVLRDSLLFGKAVAEVIKAETPVTDGRPRERIDWKLLLQDWEGATTALAVGHSREGLHTYLTLHNSYDMPLSRDDLHKSGMDPELAAGGSVLLGALPLVDRTVFTVSSQFAADFTDDILQAEVMAPRLKEALKSRLLGIDNGPFAKLSVDDEAILAAVRGNFVHLRGWKAEKKREAVQALKAFAPTENTPVWGNVEEFAKLEMPWFVMAGRDDPRQKGYDVASVAAADFLKRGAEAQFLFFPIPGEEGHAGLQFMKKLAESFPGRVLVLPFRWSEGFFATLQGAAFGLMPSLYEPFGMANEFYLNGTPGVGRATGGIIQQIVPLCASASCSQAVQARATKWHPVSSHPTGILFRERDGIDSAVHDWQCIKESNYRLDGESPDRVEERMRYRLFRAMTFEMRVALEDAARLYHERLDEYYTLLTEGLEYIDRTFSWRRAADEYVRQVME